MLSWSQLDEIPQAIRNTDTARLVLETGHRETDAGRKRSANGKKLERVYYTNFLATSGQFESDPTGLPNSWSGGGSSLNLG
jgi:hypothetical protein